MVLTIVFRSVQKFRNIPNLGTRTCLSCADPRNLPVWCPWILYAKHCTQRVMELLTIGREEFNENNTTWDWQLLNKVKQIFPEKELRGLCPNFHIHVSESDIYIHKIGLPILQENMWTDSENIWENRSQTHECGNWDWSRAIPFLTVMGFSLQCI
jgi:hypothetical protein